MSSSSAKSQPAPQIPTLPPAPTAAPTVPSTLPDDSWGDIFGDSPAPSAPAPSVPPVLPATAPLPSVPEPAAPQPVTLTRTPEPTAVISDSPSVSLKASGSAPSPRAVVPKSDASPVAPFRLWANREGSGAKSVRDASVPFFAPPGETATELRPPQDSEAESRVEPPDTEKAPALEAKAGDEAEAKAEETKLRHGYSDPAAVTQPITLSESASGEIVSQAEPKPDDEVEAASESEAPVEEEAPKSERPLASVGPTAPRSRPRPAPMTAFAEPETKSRVPVFGVGVALAAAAALFLVLPSEAEDPAPAVASVAPAVASVAPVAEQEPAPEPEAEALSEPEAVPTPEPAEAAEPVPVEEQEAPVEAEPAAPDAEAELEAAPTAEPVEAVAPEGGDPRDQATAKLEEAKAALSEGRYRDAKALAAKSNSIKPSLSARKFLVLVACHRKKVEEAKAGLAKLPPATAARVVQECERKGVKLEESRASEREAAPAKMEEPDAVDTSAPAKAEAAEAKAEEPKVEEPKAEAPKAEEPKTEG